MGFAMRSFSMGFAMLLTSAALSITRTSDAQPRRDHIPPPPPPRDVVRERAAVDAIERSGAIRTCWGLHWRRGRPPPEGRLQIYARVTEAGAVSITFPDAINRAFMTCARNAVRARVRSLGRGLPVHTSLAVSLDWPPTSE